MDAETVEMVMYWINNELNITSPLKVEDKNCDLFEFMSLWFIGHGLGDVLLSWTIGSYEYQKENMEQLEITIYSYTYRPHDEIRRQSTEWRKELVWTN